jgi:hypothetical protein
MGSTNNGLKDRLELLTGVWNTMSWGVAKVSTDNEITPGKPAHILIHDEGKTASEHVGAINSLARSREMHVQMEQAVSLPNGDYKFRIMGLVERGTTDFDGYRGRISDYVGVAIEYMNMMQ